MSKPVTIPKPEQIVTKLHNTIVNKKRIIKPKPLQIRKKT